MKTFLLFLLTIITLGSFNAQPAKEKATCHQKYAKAFEERGAHNVEDGVYDNIIITFRKGSLADCFYGKVHVIHGKINKLDMHLKFADDSYERIQKKFRHPDEAITIEGGMSRTMVTIDDELITVIFVKSIRPKKKAYKKALDPTFDF